MNSKLFFSIALLLAPLLGGCAPVPEDGKATPDPGRLFAALLMTKEQQASSVPTESGVLLREGDSREWHRFGPEIQIISGAASDPGNPDRIFYAAGNGVVRSEDGGETWRLVTGWRESDVLQIVIDPTDGNNIYGATAWGVIVSHDGGDSWKAANEGLPEYYAKDIVLDAQDPERLLLATTTGLFESTDRAETWERVASFPEVAVLRLHQGLAGPDVWIAGTEGEGVWISRDDGRTWQSSNPRLAGENIYAVALDPFDPDRMAAGGWGTGVHLSNDGGRTWKRAPAALPSPNVMVMLFDREVPGRLWASTFEEGTFHTDDSGESWSEPHLYGAYVLDLGYL